jgi:hypothetical protein
MGLMDEIKLDIQDITSNSNEFGISITFTNPSDTQTIQVVGTASNHFMQFDFESGKNINSQNTHVTVSEQLFIDAGYKIRNVDNKVSMKKHRVSWIDTTGVSGSYEVIEAMPDQSVGLIVFILGNRKA